MLERSWTTDINITGRREPLGALGIPLLLAIPLWTGVVSVAGALGYGAYETLFGVSQTTFDEGWKDISQFDQRMAALKELWLKFDQDIQRKCPRFLKRDGGKSWREFKQDLNAFGAFYGRTGTHSWALTGAPTPVEIAGAIAQLETLVGWGQAVEQTCPGTFPGLGLGLSPSQQEAAAEKSRVEAAGKPNDFGSNFGSNLGLTLGVGIVGLLGLVWLTGSVKRGFNGLGDDESVPMFSYGARIFTETPKGARRRVRRIRKAFRERGWHADAPTEWPHRTRRMQ